MWPFRKKPDNRVGTRAAFAIAQSLADEPYRWSIEDGWTGMLRHDSGIMVDTENAWIHRPWIDDEPEVNAEIIADGIDRWISARMKAPAAVEARGG